MDSPTSYEGALTMAASHRIARYTLRTTAVPAARAFYASVLGHEQLTVFPLHEQALARGARPHWLGQIEVVDVEATAKAFVALGAEPLGPVGTFPDGRSFAVLRDPGGAIVGLTSPAPDDEPQIVAWHQLHTNDRPRAEAAYTALFGWRLTTRTTHPEYGEFQHFAWPNTDADAGSITDIRGRAGRHPHWLLFMRVADLDRAMAAVRASNGVAMGPFALPSGERVAVCDDAQGAAFGLICE